MDPLILVIVISLFNAAISLGWLIYALLYDGPPKRSGK